ncbi:MAG: hypothetical protein ACOYYS_16310 [Chloroflexota bacterium]
MSPQSRTPIYMGLGLVLLVVLAAAAFFAGRLINQKAVTPDGLPMLGSGPGNGQMVGLAVSVKPAPELPQTPPELNGLFTKRDDKSIFIGTMTGNMGMGVTVSEGSSDGGPEIRKGPSYDGPVVEVVITSETKLYVETTQLDPSQASQEVQQTVGPGNLDDLGSDSMVTVWGRRTGDRVIADVVLYSSPMMITLPGE